MSHDNSFKSFRPSFDRPSPFEMSSQRSHVSMQSPYSRLIDISMAFPSRHESSFNQSMNQSSLSIAEKSRHSLKTYGSILPVIVIEAISSEVFAFGSLSVKISDSGWSWMVCGRKLFVWRYKQSTKQLQSRGSQCPCYVLQLPPSDLAHKAELICVFFTDEKSQHIPSTIAVSPEGIIRYWHNIAYEGQSIETIANDLQGQECISLTDIQPLGCILGTTTSSLVHVTINNTDGHNSIVCRTLKVPQGLLTGFGRRVNSFIFGAMPATQSNESKPLIKVLRDTDFSSNDFEVEQYIWVLAGSSVQKWQIMDRYSDRLISDLDLERPVRDAFLDKVWNRETTHPNQLQIWPIDIALRKAKEIVLLVAGLNVDVSNQLYYALATLSDKSNFASNSSVSFSSFMVLRNHTVCYSQKDEELLLDMHLLTGTVNSQAVYVYNHNRILCALIGSDDVDVLDFNGNDDGILGAGICDGLPLLFTRKDTIISIIPHQFDTRDLLKDSRVEDDIVEGDDHISILRKAFRMFLKGENVRSVSLVSKYFPQLSSNNKLLNESVASLSKELCDEIPHSDPRWAETVNSKSLENTSTIVSSIILKQIEEKLRIHNILIEFLKMSGIWERLTTITVKGMKFSTQMSVCDDAEKVIAAMTLRKLHVDFNALLDEGIKIVLQERNATIPPRLTAQDVFYHEITKIDDVISALVSYEHDVLSNGMSEMSAKQILTLVLSVSQILISIFRDVCVYRHEHEPLYECALISKCEYIPWSSSSGPNGIRGSLIKQFDFIVNFGIESINVTCAIEDDIQLKGIIYQSIVDLSDIVLNGFVCQLRSIEKGTERYTTVERTFESFRSKCLKPLFSVRQYDRAGALAEKYQDFDVLIRICEELDNNERLERYMNEFSNKGFPQYLYNWYIKERKEAKMLTVAANTRMLNEFLKNHDQLNWLHQIHMEQYGDASNTLKKLALNESRHIPRKKTLFSLSKLASLASGEQNFTDIDQHLQTIFNQEMQSENIQTQDIID